MSFGGVEDLGGRTVEVMVLGVRVVDTLTEELWGVKEDDGMIMLGDDNAGEGVFTDKEDCTDMAGEAVTDSENLG